MRMLLAGTPALGLVIAVAYEKEVDPSSKSGTIVSGLFRVVKAKPASRALEEREMIEIMTAYRLGTFSRPLLRSCAAAYRV
jgi:hypothetical protein